MPRYEHHIFICTNQRPAGSKRPCCDPLGAEELRLRFKKLVKEKGLAGRVRANKSGCLDHCEHGPTVVIYPEQVWYGGVKPGDAQTIIEEHIMGGRIIKELQMDENCINNRNCPHRLVGNKQPTTTNSESET